MALCRAGREDEVIDAEFEGGSASSGSVLEEKRGFPSLFLP